MLGVFSCVFSSTGDRNGSGAPLSRPQAGGSFPYDSTLSQAHPRPTFILESSRHLARGRASSSTMTDHARNSSGVFQNMSAKPRPLAPCIATWTSMTHPPQASKLQAYLRAHSSAAVVLTSSAADFSLLRFLLRGVLIPANTARSHFSLLIK